MDNIIHLGPSALSSFSQQSNVASLLNQMKNDENAAQALSQMDLIESDPEVQNAWKKSLQAMDVALLKRFIHFCLVHPDQLKEALAIPEICRICAEEIVEATRTKNEPLLRFLDQPGVLEQTLKNQSDLYDTTVLSYLFDRPRLPKNIIKAFVEDDALTPKLVVCLEDALVRNDLKTVQKFKGTQIIPICLKQTSNGLIISKLVGHDLILPEEFAQKVAGLAPEAQGSITKELGIALQQARPDIPFIEKFLNAGVHWDEKIVWLAVKTGDPKLVKIFQDKGADIIPSLFLLVKNHQNHVFYPLFNHADHHRLNPDLQDNTGRTLLRAAVEENQAEMVECLLASGANPLILDSTGTSLFELAKQKSPQVQTMLYYPDKISSRSGSGGIGWNSHEQIAQETVLRETLNQLSGGKPAQKYYALFLRVHDVVIAVLQSDPYFSKLHKSSSEANVSAQLNHIRCWVDEKTFPLSTELCERITHNSMNTLAFAIVQSNVFLPEALLGKKNWYLLPLPNEYKANNSSLDYGFKYSFQNLMVHGHGRNPAAAQSALKEHVAGLHALQVWGAPPDLSSYESELNSTQTELAAIFEEERDNRPKLEQLRLQTQAFIKDAQSLMLWQGQSHSLSQDLDTQNQHMEATYEALSQEIQSLHRYTFTQARANQWAAVANRQIESLQALLKVLKSDKALDTGHFQSESKSMQTHLYAIKKMVVDRNVTSAELPTIRIYHSRTLVEDIFDPDEPVILRLKKATCSIIGAHLIRIPSDPENSTLIAHFKESLFRQRALTQLENEAQFLVQIVQNVGPHHRLIDPINIQRLASYLAWQRNAHELLTTMLSIVDGRSPSFREALHKNIENYGKARQFLDGFWKKFCANERILEENLTSAHILLHQRLLLMDEEIRQENDREFVYPELENRNPKRILDEQLFLLHTAYLMALSCQQGQQENAHCLQGVLTYVQLKLKPSIQGTAKERPPAFRLFVESLLDILGDIEKFAKAAWEADPTADSPFASLHDLFAQTLPAKDKVVKELTEALKKLSLGSPRLALDGIQPIIETARTAGKLIHTLCGQALGTNELRINRLQMCLDHVSQTLQHVLKPKKESRNILAFELLDRVGKLAPEELAAQMASLQNANLVEQVRIFQQQIKTMNTLENITAAKTRQIQEKCSALREAIKISLIGQLPSAEDWSFKTNWEPVEALFSADKQEALRKADASSWDSCFKKLTTEGMADRDYFSALNQLIFHMEKHFSTKGRNKAHEFSELMFALHQLQTACWNQFKPAILGELDGLVQQCQMALNQSYYKKLQELGDQLCLGIRSQIYYTSKNENMTCYLWDGEPFDATSIHTEDDTHIPLVNDEAWESSQHQLRMREFMHTQQQALHAWQNDDSE